MYNRIGLQTPRGSGTSGYVQANLANQSRPVRSRLDFLKQMRQLKQNTLDTAFHANPAVLQHKQKREIYVLLEDMRPLPGRGGLAAASMSGMAAGAVIAPYAPLVALVLLWGALFAHAVLLGLLAASLLRQPAEARSVNPTLHMSVVGFIVAAADFITSSGGLPLKRIRSLTN